MVQVTPSASKAVRDFMQEKNLVSPLRVFLNQSSCCGPSLGLRIEEETLDTDDQVVVDGQTYLIDKGLGVMTGGVTLDFIDDNGQQGFTLTTARPMGGGSCDCSSGSCGSGGCC